MAKLKTLRQRMADGTMPPPAEFKNPEECIAAYESGFEGAIYDPDGAEEVEAQPDGVFGDAAHKYGIADSGKGKLILSYASCWEVSGRDDWFHGLPIAGRTVRRRAASRAGGLLKSSG